MSELTLLQQQYNLQLEADEVVHELQLNTILATVGTPVRVGSSALGLMVWRDVDVTVICPTLQVEKISKLATQLMVQRGVRELRFLNDSGSLKSDSQYPDGLYFSLKYKSDRDVEWKFDIWFVDEPERQPDLQHVQTMPNRLTPELRESILSIKSVYVKLDEYGKTVKSYDIYTAVLDDGVRTPAQFNEWLANKNK